MAQSAESKAVHDLGSIWRTIEAMGFALAEDRGKASASELGKRKQTCMILGNKKPDTDVALTARPAIAPPADDDSAFFDTEKDGVGKLQTVEAEGHGGAFPGVGVHSVFQIGFPVDEIRRIQHGIA